VERVSGDHDCLQDVEQGQPIHYTNAT
jgi:hypothetical protein